LLIGIIWRRKGGILSFWKGRLGLVPQEQIAKDGKDGIKGLAFAKPHPL